MGVDSLLNAAKNAVVEAAVNAANAAVQSLTSLAPLGLIAEHERLLQLRTALPALALMPETLHLRDALGEPFEMTLEAISTSAYIDIQALVGEQISVRLRQEDGSYRPWHGYALAAQQAGTDGGLARYRLVCRPWLSYLGARINSHVHQDKTALQIAEAIFAEYPQAHWRVDVSPDTLAAMRVRDLCIQYRESDLALVSRLLAEEGLLFHFEHLDDAASQQADAVGHARHVMVITDGHSPQADLGILRFTQPRPDLNLPEPPGTVNHLHFQAQAPLAGASVGRWGAEALHGHSAIAGEAAQPEHYDGAAQAHANASQAQRAADQILAASELASQRYFGRGNARHLAAGACVAVTEHPLAMVLPMQLLAVEYWATNNLGKVGEQAAARRGVLGAGECRHQFEAAPASLALAPAMPVRSRAPVALTARVVGVDQARLTTERDLRVKVQFDFQRGERPNRGGAAYGPAVAGDSSNPPAGNAPGNEHSGTWLRVMVPVAGADWGWALPPRIGSEVLVYFAHGDIDQPVLGGSVYGGTAEPPFAAGVDSGVNHPGTISGLQSSALDDANSSQWVHDDATGQLRIRLLNAQWGSELSLGHLIQQGAQSAYRGAWRGAGFESLTQGWATVRGAEGLLLSTQARAGSYGSAEGAQMDAAEALSRLNAARDLGQRLGDAAGTLGAQGLTGHADEQALQRLATQIDPDQDGHHPDQVNGQPATMPDDGRAGAGKPVPAFAKPLVALDSASALLAASGASTQVYAGQSLSLVAQGDLHQTAAHTYAQVSGQGSSLYAHEGGITAHAASGPVSVRAHTDQFQLLADQGITISSVNDEIRITAQNKITLGAADSSIVLDGADITITTPGAYKQQGGTHAFLPGQATNALLPLLPAEACNVNDEAFCLVNRTTGEPASGVAYVLYSPTGSLTGRTDDDGMTHRIATGSATYTVSVNAVEDDVSYDTYPSGAIEGC